MLANTQRGVGDMVTPKMSIIAHQFRNGVRIGGEYGRKDMFGESHKFIATKYSYNHQIDECPAENFI